jgi:predicted metal-dependent phosphoesterase TrpH
MDDGGFRVDPHVKVLDERVVERAKARGLDALVYAPHFTHLSTVRERAARFSDDDLLVVPAREVFTGHWNDRRHVLAVDPDDPVPDFLSFSTTMAQLDRQDAAVLVPHPGFLNVSLSLAHVRRYRDVLDAVEVYNPKHLPWDNRRARAIAAGADLPRFTSSYAHLRSTVGEAWIEFEDPMDSPADLTAAFERGAPRAVRYRDGPAHRARCLAEFAHLGWENSWGKFARIVLDDRAATHPRNPVYGGRFDELSVY